ncbi:MULTISPECIES: hypothetical protein [Clavibacter]|uniref:Uncharacterized protein n=1 Tax=Clavibacter seminis TaxID=2860285 RepID=A0ABY3T6M5_9MICO|nr:MULTISPECIES: hypothetical protein [Clavibacter]KDP91822.1 hypothetical protein W824_04930 [Clavibacter cf. michiganensis LMG 26808]UKF24760.1 hypothetical protein KYT88_13725 [Clavibacter sp. A6099]
MRAPRLLLVPALVAALAACSAASPASPTSPADEARPLVERGAEPAYQDAPETLPVEDAAIPLDPGSLVAWSPSDAPVADAHVDISWADAALECDHAVDRVRVDETATRVVVDLQQGADVDDGIECGDSQSLRTARIPLAEPLGDRELLQHAPPAG